MLKPNAILLSIVLTIAFSPLARAQSIVRPDVVYGHKYGLALTYDVFAPEEKANGD